MGKAWNMEVIFEKADKIHGTLVEFIVPPHMDLSRVSDPLGHFHHVNSVAFEDKKYSWFEVDSASDCQDLFKQMKTAMTKQYPDMEVKMSKPEARLLEEAAQIFAASQVSVKRPHA